MDFFIDFPIPGSEIKIEPHHKILLIGSCFTEHMGMRLDKWGWHILQNPTGVIYNPMSVVVTLDRILHNRGVRKDELIYNQELFHHWDFHSRFSHFDADKAMDGMNTSISTAHDFLKEADWLFVTWGRAHYYTFRDTGYQVSNCHRVPHNAFTKDMYSVAVMKNSFSQVLSAIKRVNPKLHVCQTVSPVRHIRDGVMQNSRSKARLLEMSYQLLEDEGLFYFPAYEILIDQLRDYRFFDADLVHPNYAATQYVWERFSENFFSKDAVLFLKKMMELNDAYNHKPRFEGSGAHELFLKKYKAVSQDLEKAFTHLDLSRYIQYFSTGTREA